MKECSFCGWRSDIPCSDGTQGVENVRNCINVETKGVTKAEAHLRLDFAICVHGNIGCDICGNHPEEPVKVQATEDFYDPRISPKPLKLMSEPPKAESLQATLDARGNRYGEFADNALIAQRLKEIMREGIRWEAMPAFQREALDIIASKISRMLSGDPNYADNWHDIQGFAKLVEERLPKQQ